MKWELDDTTSDGIRFLLVGAGGLLVLRLGYLGISHLLTSADDALALACRPLQQGYWLGDAHSVASTAGGGVGARLALAVVAAVAMAVIGGLVVYIVSRSLGRTSLAAVRTMRVILVMALAWWLHAALAVPRMSTRFTEVGIERTMHMRAIGDLPWPWGTERYTIPWNEVSSIDTHAMDDLSTVSVQHGSYLFTLATGTNEEAATLVAALGEYVQR
jgi:hypothetical protein